MKNHFRKGAFRWASLILTVVMAVNLLPLTAMAADPEATVFEVATAGAMTGALATINADTSDTSEYVISLLDDIECTSCLTVKHNHVSILGNGHTLKFNTSQGDAICVKARGGSNPVLSLGKENGTTEENTLTITRSKGANLHRDGTPFIAVGEVGNGAGYKGVLKMYNDVSIQGVEGSHTYGGAVTVGSGGTFEMNGGSIKNCGINGGSICFGGGVAVVGGGVFTMNRGTISGCFVKSTGNSWTVPWAAGGGVFVGNGSTFQMNGGTIQNNYAAQDGGGVCVIASKSSYSSHSKQFGYLDSKFTMKDGSQIIDNNAGVVGGGLAVLGTYIDAGGIAAPTPSGGTPDDPGIYISGGTFERNKAADGGGGLFLLWVQTSIPVQIWNAAICQNAANEGAGIYALDKWTKADIYGCTIAQNIATKNGGGIALLDGADGSCMTIGNTVIKENQANSVENGRGGGICVSGEATLSFQEDCAVYDNTAAIGADDVYKDGTSTINNLPTAEQMNGTHSGANLSGWYWDYKTINGTYEYPEDVTHPCARYDSTTNAVVYTPVSSEMAERYLKAVQITDFRVQFDKNCTDTVNDMPATQSVAPGQTADELTDPPTRDGYVFDGWYKDALCTQRYDFSSPVTANITLYAKWVQGLPSGGGTGGSGGGTSAYTLRYQSNGGTPCPDETKTSAWSKDYDSLPVPVREGYLFTGWFADSGLQTPISEDVQVNRRLVTIYAGWEKSMVPAMLNGDDHYAYVQGYSDGTVRPNDNITRAEVATIFFRLLKDEIREENLSDVNTFEDVTDGMWCNKAISTMAVLGVVKGRTAEYFDPDAPITRGEFAAICSRFDKSDIVARENFTDIEGYWAKEEIERAAILGWVRGYTDGSFRPRNYITRAEAMTMINRVLHRVPESPEDLLPDMVTWPDNKLTDWYYLAVQEATNSHIPERKVNGYESWFALTDNRDWSIYQS